uniref:Uncharacterized protein n=1 Tax=Amphimedon queenslandica TaxID=400682 RepID=A0A1X7VPI3_AMPQE
VSIRQLVRRSTVERGTAQIRSKGHEVWVEYVRKKKERQWVSRLGTSYP